MQKKCLNHKKILGHFLIRNINIFKPLYESHTSRNIDSFDSAVNSDFCSIVSFVY